MKQKKSKKLTRSKLIKELDKRFSLFIRLRGVNNKGINQCYTCGTYDHYKKLQCGHFISRGNYQYRRDEDNCKIQCYTCNIIRNGNYKPYTIRMIDEYGREKIEAMLSDKSLAKISSPELQEKINHYKTQVVLIEKQLIDNHQ